MASSRECKLYIYDVQWHCPHLARLGPYRGTPVRAESDKPEHAPRVTRAPGFG